MERVFAKPNLVIEPLFMQWYAWSHLISPATAAMNVTKRHMEIMNSYIDSPEQHQEAIKDPKMLGGPFVDLNGEYIEEIKKLIEDTKENCSKLISLNNSIKEINNLLKNEAKGASLEKVYTQIPKNLRE